jgi:Glycosyl transferase family 2
VGILHCFNRVRSRRLTTNNSNSSVGSVPFSIIIPAHNDWNSLGGCLRSLAEQRDSPKFEVIVVDDGSREPAPDSIREWNDRYPLSIVRQPNAGIATARNRGIQEASGEILVCTDADCRFQKNCLSALGATIAAFPQHSCFQLHIIGDCSNTVGRAEELRLTAIQDQTLLDDGRIRYLNTSGFAIRRSHFSIQEGRVFDPAILRGEDTLLLVGLIQRGELPFFVSSAKVQHSISLSYTGCLRKDIRCAWLEGRTLEVIATTGLRMRMTNNQRFRMLLKTWKLSRQPAIGRLAWIALATRQLLERTVSVIYSSLHR